MSETTVETPTPEVAETPVEIETPVIETAETPVEAVEATEPVAEAEQPTDPSRLEKLLEALGEIPEQPSEALLESLDARSIENLPSAMKGLFKHLVAAERQRVKQQEEKMSTRNSELDKKFEELKDQNRVVIRNRAQLNQVLTDPKFQEYLKIADMPEEELADPYSEEGIQQRIKKGVAEAMAIQWGNY